MDKKILLLIYFISLKGGLLLHAQNCNLSLMTSMDRFSVDLPATAKIQLESKLKQLVTINGMYSQEFSSHFMLTAELNVLTKNILPGPPIKISQSIEITFYVMDITQDKIYSSFIISSKGIGENETKSFLDAIRQINVRNKELQFFIDNSKSKIIQYYNDNYPTIIKRAQQLATIKDFSQAFYEIASIPECCNGYNEGLLAGLAIYESYKNELCMQNLNQARAIWLSTQTTEGASMAVTYLTRIFPDVSCYEEAISLYEEIKRQVKDDIAWERKQYDDNIIMEKQKISMIKEIGVAYGTGQQSQTTNLNFIR